MRYTKTFDICYQPAIHCRQLFIYFLAYNFSSFLCYLACEVLTTSFSKNRHTRVGGQSSTLLSHVPNDCARSVYSSNMSRLS